MKAKIFRTIITLVLIVSLSILPTTTALAGVMYTFSQDITAYTSEPGRLTRSGVSPFIGTCAVHPWRAGDPGNGPAQFNFGSSAILSQMVPMYPGNTSRASFTILDTGDYDFVYSPHFIDVWQGTDTKGGTINKWCWNSFGVKHADITFVW